MSELPSVHLILKTLDDLAYCAKNAPEVIALLGAGSTGLDLQRIDEYSDLDFFLIVKDGFSRSLRETNSWFAERLPIGFWFRDTEHGNKVLLDNGVFMEFAIFEESEWVRFLIPGLRKIWSIDGFELPKSSFNIAPEKDAQHFVDQALANLYIGMLRWHRGEKLAANLMIERYAFENTLRAMRTKAKNPIDDPFIIERRAEKNFDLEFNRFLKGLDRTPESARAIFSLLSDQFWANPKISDAIKVLLAMAED